MKQNTLFSNPKGPKVSHMPKKRPKAKIDERILELINRRERQVLIHANLYYRHNINIISDFTYDKWSHELVELIQEHPNEFRKSAWYSSFMDFDGNTGMDLPLTDLWVESTASHLLKIYGGHIGDKSS